MKNIMKKAHEMTREIKKEFPNVDYKSQLGICMSFLANEEEVEVSTEDRIVALLEKTAAAKGVYSTMNVWEKGNFKRLYLGWNGYVGKSRIAVKCGYIDLSNDTYVTFDRYNKIFDLEQGKLV